MSLSKELKKFIIEKYEDKIKKIEQEKFEEIKTEKEKYIALQTEKLKEIAIPISENIKQLIEIIKDNDFEVGYYLNQIKGYKNICEIKKFNSDEIEKKYAPKIEKLNKERDRLIIKLSLEKDFDNICEMLKEYDIEL